MSARAGLVIVNTGDGKGKTTAALGAAMRAAGHGRRVLMLQFIKGEWKSGEHDAVHKLEPRVQIRRVGKGFLDPATGPMKEDISGAREGLEQAADALSEGTCELVILDEIINAVNYGLLSVEEVVETVRSRRPGVDVILTGRDAPAQIIEMADTVTEFKEIKHPFTEGVKARKGIEF